MEINILRVNKRKWIQDLREKKIYDCFSNKKSSNEINRGSRKLQKKKKLSDFFLTNTQCDKEIVRKGERNKVGQLMATIRWSGN